MPIAARRTPLKVPSPKKLDLAKRWHLPNRPSENRLKPWPPLGNKADKAKVSSLENLNQEKDNQARDNPGRVNPVKDNPAKVNPVKVNPVKVNPVKDNPVKDNPVKGNPEKDNPEKDNPVRDKGLPPHLPAKPP